MKINTKNLKCISLTILLGISILLGIFILDSAKYGFEFSDSGFYLNWISNPSLYSWSLSQFGFVYSPVYYLFNENLVSLKMFNIIFTYVISFIFSVKFINIYFKKLVFNYEKFVIAFLTSFLSINIFSFWLVLPNYNTLNFQGLIICFYGIISLKDNRKFGNYFLVALGGLLIFLAKPSTAFLLLMILTGYFISKKEYYSLLITGINSILLLLFSSFIIDRSFLTFLKRIFEALRIVENDGMKHTIFDSLRFDFPIINIYQWFLILLMIIMSLYFVVKILEKKIKKIDLMIYLLQYITVLKFINYSVQMMSIFGFLFPVVLITAYLLKNKSIKLSNENIFFIVLFLFTPYIASFGSNNNYWVSMGFYSYFYLICSLYLVSLLINISVKYKILYYIVLSFFLINIVSINYNIHNLYRQPYFNENNIGIIEFEKNNFIYADNTIIQFISDILDQTKNSGFKKGTSVIDLTGQSPGVLFLMEAKVIAQPWIIGGHSSSFELAKQSISFVTCEDLNESWILIEPNGPRSIDSNLLKYFNLNIEKDFTLAAKWLTSYSMGGYIGQRDQFLFKPIHTKKFLLKNCVY